MPRNIPGRIETIPMRTDAGPRSSGGVVVAGIRERAADYKRHATAHLLG